MGVVSASICVCFGLWVEVVTGVVDVGVMVDVSTIVVVVGEDGARD